MKRRPLLWIAGLLIALFAVLAWKLSLKAPSLLERARKIADVSDWDDVGHYKLWPLGQYWLDNEHLLFSPDARKCMILNTRTGQKIASPAFTRATKDRDSEGIYLSPDRNWLLSYEFHITKGTQIIEVNGLQQNELDAEGRRIWLWDSRHYITWAQPRTSPDERADDSPEGPMETDANGKVTLLVRSVSSLKVLQRIIYKPTTVWPPMGKIVSCPDHFVMLEDFDRDYDAPTLTTVESGLGLYTGSDRKHVIHLPEPARTESAALSAQGDRIAFVFRFASVPSAGIWLHRLLPFIPIRQRETLSLWTCRIDGSDLQEIGQIPIHSEDDMIDQLQWLPDGRHISFDYNNTLYTISAD